MQATPQYRSSACESLENLAKMTDNQEITAHCRLGQNNRLDLSMKATASILTILHFEHLQREVYRAQSALREFMKTHPGMYVFRPASCPAIRGSWGRVPSPEIDQTIIRSRRNSKGPQSHTESALVWRCQLSPSSRPRLGTSTLRLPGRRLPKALCSEQCQRKGRTTSDASAMSNRSKISKICDWGCSNLDGNQYQGCR